MKFIAQPLYDLYRSLLRNSKYRWLIAAASLIYLVSPIDFITDVIPVLGWIDDGVVATVLMAEVSQLLVEQLKNRKSQPVDDNPVTETV
jgi:uncharacterized membrane protein YkvA (DUF1232 family)